MITSTPWIRSLWSGDEYSQAARCSLSRATCTCCARLQSDLARRWYLPSASVLSDCARASATVVGDRVYFMGGNCAGLLVDHNFCALAFPPFLKQ